MIQIENLNFNYGKKHKLFNNLNLSLEGGHIHGLLGKNGTGKTTLLKIVMGLLFPKSGECHVLNYKSSARKPSLLSDMMFVPEEFYAPSCTIKQYVALYAPYYPNFSQEQFNVLMEEFELLPHSHLKALSLGQKKKVILAFAMAANTRILILDEPTNGLDIPSKIQFRRMIASIATQDRCIIISTHQVQDIDSLIDSVIVLGDGEIILNENIEMISKKLCFKTSPEAMSGALYAEETFAGYQSILPNNNNEYTQINLEILFKAITSKNPSINNIFNQQKQ